MFGYAPLCEMKLRTAFGSVRGLGEQGVVRAAGGSLRLMVPWA